MVIKFRTFLGKEVWRIFLTALFLGFLWFAVESSFIFVLQGFLQALGLTKSDQLYLPSFYPTTVLGSVAVLLSFGLVRATVYTAKIYFDSVSNQVFIRDQRARLTNFALNNFERVTAHEVLTTFNERIIRSGYVIQAISQLINTSTTCLLLAALGLRIAPRELIIGVALTGLLMIPVRKLDKKIEAFSEGLTKASADIGKRIVMGLQNNFFLKIYNLIDEEVSHTAADLRRYEFFQKKFFLFALSKESCPQLIGYLVICILTYTSLTYFGTSGTILLSFFYIFIRFAQGLSSANSALSLIQLNIGYLRELYSWNRQIAAYDLLMAAEIAQASPASTQGGDPTTSPKLQIEGHSLTYGYDEKTTVFTGLSFQVTTGQMLLIRGKSGAGKSTLLTLILGINKPRAGAITVNGIPSHAVRGYLAARCGYVGPDPFLIPGSVRENLLYGAPKKLMATDADLWHALKLANADGIVEKFSRGLDEYLNEQTQLSTGQKQRMALARALVRKPKILILDEATANLDAATESEVLKSLGDLIPTLTTIAISHKPSFNHLATAKIDL